MYIFTYVDICIYNINEHVYICTCMYIHICIYMCVCDLRSGCSCIWYTLVSVSVWFGYVYIRVCVWFLQVPCYNLKNIHIYMRIYICVCMYIYMYVCVWFTLGIICIYILMSICLHDSVQYIYLYSCVILAGTLL